MTWEKPGTKTGTSLGGFCVETVVILMRKGKCVVVTFTRMNEFKIENALTSHHPLSALLVSMDRGLSHQLCGSHLFFLKQTYKVGTIGTFSGDRPEG